MKHENQNTGSQPKGDNYPYESDRENATDSNTNRTKDDGLSGRAEQEETANKYTYIEGHDEEDIEDMNSLKGIMKNRDEKKSKDS
jgi:hypothetical protein